MSLIKIWLYELETVMVNKNSKIFVAGHKGLIGSAIVRKLKQLNYKKIYTKTKSDLDLWIKKKF